MRMGIEEIEVKEDKTVQELMDELKITSPILIEVNGEVFYPDENYGKILKRGDIVTLIPIIGGG
jgi:thiamine biosynthesis protein ThiS